MAWTAEDIPSQEGRLALVTGANSGLGLATIQALAARQATVILACRSSRKAEAAQQQLQDQGLSRLELLELDLADLSSVQRAAESVRDRYGHLDLLINNAGVMAPHAAPPCKAVNCNSASIIWGTWHSPRGCWR